MRNGIRKCMLCLVFVPVWCGAQTEVLDAFFQKMERQTLEAEFAVTVEEGASQPMTYSGELVMRGEKFRLTMWNMEAAYDGETLYIYSEDTDELTLSTPTAQDMAETNPLLFAKALREASKQRFAAGQSKTDMHVIEFVPAMQGTGVQKFVLVLRKADLLPQEVVMKESATQQTVLRFRNPQYTQREEDFRLMKENAVINDLR